jgi:hypothetical protein
MADLSQYGTVSKAPPDLSQYGVVSGGPAPDDGSGSLKGFIQNSPVGVVKGAADFLRHPVDTLTSMGQQNVALLDKAKESYSKGDYAGALFHALNYVLPGGAALDDAGQDFANGHISRGTAKTLGIASTLVAGAKAPQLLEAAGKAVDAAPAAIDAAKAGVKAAAPDVAVGAAKVGAGAVLPKIPGLSYGMEYVGGRQIIKGLGKGVDAARESFHPTVAETPVAVNPDAALLDGIAQGYTY